MRNTHDGARWRCWQFESLAICCLCAVALLASHTARTALAGLNARAAGVTTEPTCSPRPPPALLLTERRFHPSSSSRMFTFPSPKATILNTAIGRTGGAVMLPLTTSPWGNFLVSRVPASDGYQVTWVATQRVQCGGGDPCESGRTSQGLLSCPRQNTGGEWCRCRCQQHRWW